MQYLIVKNYAVALGKTVDELVTGVARSCKMKIGQNELETIVTNWRAGGKLPKPIREELHRRIFSYVSYFPE